MSRDPLDDVQLLYEMVGIYSPSGEEARLAQRLAEHCEAAGLRARLDEVGNVVIDVGSGPPHVVLLGHLDTVAGERPVKLDGDLLWGRGAVDAKPALAAFVCAAARLAGHCPARITVVGAVQEETPTSLGARQISRRPAPDAVIVGEPSGASGVTIGYRGCTRLEYAVAMTKRHSAVPEPTAAERVVEFWNALTLDCRRRSAGREGFHSWTPRLVDIATTDDGVTEAAHASVSVRTPVDADPRFAEPLLEATAPTVTYRYCEQTPAVLMPRDSAIARAMRVAIRRHGGRPEIKVKSGTSDMNVLATAWRVPMIAYGAGDSALDHTPEERVSIAEYCLSIDVLVSALTDWAATTVAPSEVMAR